MVGICDEGLTGEFDRLGFGVDAAALSPIVRLSDRAAIFVVYIPGGYRIL